MRRKIRMGMIGGGEGAFIGAIHRMAAALDGQIELVCGAFSSDPEKSNRSGEMLFLDPNRVYGSYEEMIKLESSLSADIRMDFVSIVTPNHLHFAPAKMALQNGFNVLVDKPLCFDLNEAQELKSIVDKSNLLFAISYNYTAYPMVKQAKSMIANGKLGRLRKIVVEYAQGWLTTAVEKTGQKQASWRTDPNKAGKAGALGDIGSHAQNLAEYMSGLKIVKLCAQVNTLVDGRSLDDDTNILLKFNNGASGVLIASQVSAGEENNLKIKLYGELGGLEWSQMSPNNLIYRGLNQAMQILRTGGEGLDSSSLNASRLPAGHPEGYIEAFANIYKSFSNRILDGLNDENADPHNMDIPDINDGYRGMLFIEKAIESGRSEEKWISL